MRTRIKICGITDPATARIAAQAGADAIGLVFHGPSARALELAQGAEIARAAAPFVTTVAVMVNPAAEWVREIIARVSPACLQFHGDEAADFCAAFGLPYLKALRIGGDGDGGGGDACPAASETRYASAHGILLDTAHAEMAGGSGVSFDWNLANYGGKLPLILAGGLTAHNIGEAITRVRPYGVDVSSGVESDGRKDAEKIRRFCGAAAASDLENAHSCAGAR
ncbi:MAG: phosphoribosylanthranilate isomerase [Gammaproteobacteria bacterium]